MTREHTPYDGGQTPSLADKIAIMGREIDRLRGLLASVEREASAGARASFDPAIPIIVNQTFARIADLANQAGKAV